MKNLIFFTNTKEIKENNKWTWGFLLFKINSVLNVFLLSKLKKMNVSAYLISKKNFKNIYNV